MSDLLQSLEKLAKSDDIDAVSSLHSKFSRLPAGDLVRALKSSEMNPILVACEHGNRRVSKAMGRLWPELVRGENQHGNTAIHMFSARGDVEMVLFFGEVNRQVCLVEDNCSMIPLHRAAINGHSDVIKALVSICPESLEKLTSDGETVLHLALKHSKLDAFRVLLDQIKTHNREHLFNRKDNDGNNLLHIATFKKFTQIVKFLLESSNFQTVIRVNSMNKQGQTALQLCTTNSGDMVFNEIGPIIQAAVTRQQTSPFTVEQSPPLPADGTTIGGRNLARWPMETRNVLLMVLVKIAAALFTVTSNLPANFLKQNSLIAGKDVTISGGVHPAPTVFYLMTFNSVGFMTTMFVILVIIWPLNFRTTLLFLVICTCIVYILLVDEIMPKFFVIVWKFRISCLAFMWSLVLPVAIAICGISVLGMGKCIELLRRFIRWLWIKATSC